IQQYGLWFVFFNVLVLQAGLPVPAYPTLIITGALATRGGASLPALAAVAILAALIADLAWYHAGRRFGSGVLKTICRVSLSPDSCVRQTESIFARWGARSLAVAKFIPGFASVATSMAGVVRLPLWKFIPFDALGAALWSGVAITLGYAFSGAINQVLAVFETLGKVGLWLIAGAFVLYIAMKWWQRELFIWQLRMDRLTVDELNELMQSSKVGKVIDVRSPMSQAMTGRIPGAITVDPANIRVDLVAVEPESEVIVYCACPNEYTAAKVAKALVQHGFKRVRPLLGGIDAWVAAGHPVEKVEPAGAKVVPLKVQRTAT
ncbi:MAG: DedA family protein/thiosulfate sulfurtransferase GlpE, partial [Casimicrobiaceae bacterium]